MHRHTERPLYIPLSEPASLPELTQEYGWRTYWGKYRIMKEIKRIWQNFFHGTGRNHNKSVPNWYNLMLLVPTRRQIWTNRAESGLIFSILQYVLYRMLTILKTGLLKSMFNIDNLVPHVREGQQREVCVHNSSLVWVLRINPLHVNVYPLMVQSAM